MAFKEKLQIVQATAGAKTLTTEHVKAGTTVIKVGSTAGFPPAGEAYLVTSQAFSYTGINGTTELTGVTGVVNTFSINVSVTAPYETLLNLNDAAHFFIKSGSFKVVAPVTTRVLAQDQRRWGGAREVGAVSENGSVNWEVAVAGTTAQEAIEKVETLLAQLESNPTQLLLLWQPGEVTNPTLYEIRGAGHWEPNFENATLEGANLFMIALEIPVGPLAQGLPGVVYVKSGLLLPETISLSAIPGDAPALAEVSIETGEEPTAAFITGATKPSGLAVDSEHVYFTQPSTGYIGRCKVSEPTKPELTWLHAEGEPYGVTVDGTHVYWSNLASPYIGRATLAGGTIEKTWITLLQPSPGVAVSSTHVYWCGGGYVGRATIAGGSVEQHWFAASPTYGIAAIAVNAASVYFSEAETGVVSRFTVSGTGLESFSGISGAAGLGLSISQLYWASPGGSSIGRATLGGAEPLGSWAAASGEPVAVAVQGEYVYFTARTAGAIGRVRIEHSPGIWALLGWAPKPSAGLATAPFGLLDSSTAVAVSGWTYTTQTGARGGSMLHASERNGSAYWEVDPATMTPDSFSGEIAVEVWARVMLSELLNDEEGFPHPPMLVLSAQPQDGVGYGAPRYTDEWGSAGRSVQLPEEEEQFRITRLGTLHLLVNPLAPRIWKLYVEGYAHEAAQWGLDYLLLVPSSQRACSPSSKPNNAAYPKFIANVGPTVKTVQSNLSAVVAKPGKNGHPDNGLGGQLMQLPAGETEMFLKLSSMVPDAPEVTTASEQLAYESKVVVTVTPRFYLTRV